MNRVDKLLVRAQQAARAGLELYHAFVEPDGNSWVAEVYLGDGIPGHTPQINRTEHDTQDAAIDHIHDMARDYPNSGDVPIIILDI